MLQPCLRRMSKCSSHPFVDAVKLLISSGAGGDGASVMSHEHGNEFAGPGGGNGGRGGNVMLKGSKKVNDLSHIKAMGTQISAAPGSVGFARTAHGKKGKDLLLELPVGTTVVDVDTNEVVYDVDEDGVELLLLQGGQGGKGNAAFANKWHHSPTESTRGLPGNTMLAQLELKSLADVGLVGYPNAGKSSILSAISSSKPTIAPYAFTTKRPYVGFIYDLYGNTCRVADLPGLIEGAFENRGLGHKFLRHAERTQSLAYVIDMAESYNPSSSTKPLEPWEAVETLRRELEYYLPGLSSRAMMIFANKMDMYKDTKGNFLKEKAEELQRRVQLPVFPVSAALGIALGAEHPQAGFKCAVELMCKVVFQKKQRCKDMREAQRRLETFTLDKTFCDKNIGAFIPSGDPEQRKGDTSLVDQQFEPCGFSGLGEEFSAYQQATAARGRLHDFRDLTMKGRYWSLTRRNGERVTSEKWQ
ncbi:GTP-binding protein, putative [Trypanosoma brucei gambiense DAL972]|uniref:GTP-binding protein, putative n=2 Tax=Trypanosoma brucei TaxID=5691 RepID=D0A3H6_TRYB9|nr:GTP-binding protein, putative [Trypanosoma brucei gambiense DAL972]CBH15820.1 GTP-binding protein, putative [Trypanosoma brucei gambiense DAL972]|eukprot:XP_011778084.1 GTP-binding protein, putative [Trypanosoma brucei gambiense DAL972]